MSAPAYLSYFVVGGSLISLAALAVGFRAAAAQTGWAPEQQRGFVTRASIVFAGWLVAAIVLAMMGVYGSSQLGVPTIQYGLVTPIVIGVLIMWGSKSVRELMEAASQSWLVGIQTYRALGVIFLILYASGKLPGEFALPAGAGDVAVGLAAPLVAWAYSRNPAGNGAVVAWWNVFGLLDLVIAVGTGVLTSPSPLQQLAFDRPNILISEFPLVLIPTYLVPISILLHIASLWKLPRAAASSATTQVLQSER
jgi:hypothetical protein